MAKPQRKRGDRRDGRWVREAPGMQTVMAHLMPCRTDCEVYLHDTLDATELMKFLEKRNAEHPEFKTTIFHCFLLGLARMVKERPLMNRFIQGHRIYERYDISLSFVCKRRFRDDGGESLMWMVPHEDETIDSWSRRIVGDINEIRKSEHSTGGIDEVLDTFAKIPRLLLIPIIRFVRILDFWGKVPKALSDGDPNYSTILVSNLGSIQCPSVYHHLNNYGTNSIMITLGTVHKEPVLQPDGSCQLRDLVDVGATLDERIGDGFYFARSLKLVKYIFAHPELLDRPLCQISGFDYK